MNQPWHELRRPDRQCPECGAWEWVQANAIGPYLEGLVSAVVLDVLERNAGVVVWLCPLCLGASPLPCVSWCTEAGGRQGRAERGRSLHP